VSFSIQAGEIVGLLGHNGAGKTTVMKMVTGFLQPSSGSAVIAGVNVEHQPLQAQANIGYLPENLPLYPEMVVADYLDFVARLRGLNTDESVNAAIHRALNATGMADKSTKEINTLSRGYRQRLGVAQAILHKPAVLVLDEPTNGLDPDQTQLMRALIRDMAKTTTVILSTHIMQEVDALCDRALIMRAGRLVVDESLATLGHQNSLLLDTTQDAKVEEALSSVEGISKLEKLTTRRWRLSTVIDPQKVAAAVAVTLVSEEIPVYSLSPELRDLERVFRKINEGEMNEGDSHAA
jgi:ABC-2 type transport system ATP-binding protein